MKIHYPLLESEHLRGVRTPFVAFVEEAIPSDVCDALVDRVEACAPTLAPIMTSRGPVIDTRARDNERVIFDDTALALYLFSHTRAVLPESLDGGTLVGYNERFRGYRYKNGQRFAPHYDGAYFRPPAQDGREGSLITALFYLNEGFTGGDTSFLDYEVAVTPKKGSVLLFAHRMLHEGAAVPAGTKYVLRTDAMYSFPSAP